MYISKFEALTTFLLSACLSSGHFGLLVINGKLLEGSEWRSHNDSSHELLNVLKLDRILYAEWAARGKGRSRKAS